MQLNPQRDSKVKPEKSSVLPGIFRMFLANGKANTVAAGEKDGVRELLQSIRDARSEWVAASMNFEYAEDKDIVDYYTYQIKACQVKYDYLIKKAKEKGIKVDLPETIGTAFS